MKNEAKTKTAANGTKTAQAALAEINAQIETLHQQRIQLAEPLKTRYAELRAELAGLETEIHQLDSNWKAEPMKAKAETKITEILTSKGQPMAVEEIIAAVGGLFNNWKVKNTLKKKSTGPKAVFTLADGKYTVKTAV